MEYRRRVFQALVPKKKKWKKCIYTDTLDGFYLQVSIILLTNDTSLVKAFVL